jgi:hypothetical protein
MTKNNKFEINDLSYLINNILLPIKLHQKSLEYDVHNKLNENESLLFDLVNESLDELKVFEKHFSYFDCSVIQIFKKWSLVQKSQLNGYNVNEMINQLETIPLYIRNQNCCILIQKDSSNKKAIFSYFKVSFPNEEVMSRNSDLEYIYPERAFEIKNLDIINSMDFAILLADLSNKSIEEAQAKTVKANHQNVEVRDVPDIIFVSDWIANLLIANNDFSIDKPARIIKKTRDEVNYENTLFPFRRSGKFYLILNFNFYKLIIYQ